MILTTTDIEQFGAIQLTTTSPVALLTKVKLDELKLVNVTLLFGELQVPEATEVDVTLTGKLMQP